MGRPKKRKIENESLQGLRDLQSMRELLHCLHNVGCQRDRAGNRQLHMDEYCLLVLMWFFNPIVDSLRGLQETTGLSKVRKRLGIGRTSLGSLSESVRVFDPENLKEIAEELSHKIPDRTPEQFAAIDRRITAVDGSVFKVLTQVAELAWLPQSDGKSACGYRLHAQFEIFRGVPHRSEFTTANPKGDADERVVLERSLDPARCYLMDRGYQKYSLWNAIHQIGSQYVCRLRDSTPYEVLEERELSDDDRAAGIVSDQLVRFGASNSRTEQPRHPTRLVIVAAKPHDSRRSKNGASGPSCDGYLRIATNNQDIPAHIVSELYLLRWTIELYFRTLKQLLGCRHLLSTRHEGVTIQIYLAIIACMMIMTLTGKKPTKRTFEMICYYLMGWATLEELEDHIKKLHDAE